MRRFLIVGYDITDNKRRTRVFKFLQGWGERVQYSVFCCQVNPRERQKLVFELNRMILKTEDHILFVDAGAVKGAQPLPEISYLGAVWKPEPRVQIV